MGKGQFNKGWGAEEPMRASALAKKLVEFVEKHGDLEVVVMQEVRVPEAPTKGRLLQVESEVTDLAVSSGRKIVVVGQELI